MNYLTVEDTTKIFLEYGIPNKDLAEFGIYSGNTLKRLIDNMESIGKPFRKVWAADAFVGGLPKETEGLWQNPDWVEHAFDISADKELKNVQEAIEFVHNHVKRNNVIYVPGYFEDTLCEKLANDIGKDNLSYLHVDCDIHKSSLEVLNFVFKYGLLCIGCIIRFDDICSTPTNAGQHLAWTQTIHKYNVNFYKFCENVYQVINHDRQ